jgi:hypothetical protein
VQDLAYPYLGYTPMEVHHEIICNSSPSVLMGITVNRTKEEKPRRSRVSWSLQT